MNRQHNIGLAVVAAMVVLSIWLLRRESVAVVVLTLVLQLATGIAGGIVGNAQAMKKTRRRVKRKAISPNVQT